MAVVRIVVRVTFLPVLVDQYYCLLQYHDPRHLFETTQ